jgi:hypothetical protein
MQRPVIELGLVMAGAVSAYTAGVLDFLMEALAAYDAAQGDPDHPSHKVTLRVLSGGPGSGLDRGLFAATLDNASGPGTKRPFFAAWVDDRDAAALIDVRTLAGRACTSAHDAMLWTESGVDALLLIDPTLPLARLAPPPTADGLAGLFLRLLRPLCTEPGYRDDALPPMGVVVAPQRREENGDLTPAPLAGPLDRRFKDHDYALGRRNAQRVLARHLVLPSHHPAVAGWSEAMDRAYGIWPQGVAQLCPAPFRPIIPLTGEARRPCARPDWPALPPKALRVLERRIFKRLMFVSATLSQDYLGAFVSFVLAPQRKSAARTALAQLRRTLTERGQIEGRARQARAIAKPKPAPRPSLKLVPLTGKRSKPAPVQTIGWGHSIDGRDESAIQPISTRAESL